jgi:apolipoprotein N-acyltransferase
VVRQRGWNGLAAAVVFGLSIPVAFASPGLAKYLWVLIWPLEVLLPWAVAQRTRVTSEGAA